MAVDNITRTEITTDTVRPRSRQRARAGSLLFYSTLSVFLLFLLLIAAWLVLPKPRHIAAGVMLQERDLGGLSFAEAKQVVTAMLKPLAKQRVRLRVHEKHCEESLAMLGIQPDSAAVVAQATAIGHQGPFFRRLLQAVQTHWYPVELTPVFSLREKRARETLNACAELVDYAPVNATARWDSTAARVIVVPGHLGGKLDRHASLRLIEDELLDRLNHAQPLPVELTLPYGVKQPPIRETMLTSIDTVLSSFATTFKTSSANRATNVATAAAAIDGTVLLPGERFSFNETVGPRDSESGFMAAPVILDGQLKPGVGGGVCQVSSTLYNAVLLANLAVVRRSHHSLPVHYVAAGRDATVVYGSIDFRFRNTTGNPVLIEAKTADRQITVRILGKGPAQPIKIERGQVTPLPLRSVTQPDPTLPAGTRVVTKKGKPGLQLVVTRIIGDGPDARHEVISHDTYLGEPKVIHVGVPPATPVAGVKTITD